MRPARLITTTICLLTIAAPCHAWDTRPHQSITKAALDSLPKRYLDQFGAESDSLVEIYCMLPDRYLEMDQFGFVRNSPGPRTVAEIRVYCVRPDGLVIHGATGDREQDLRSLVYLYERILSSLSEKRPGEAVRYTGVLAHFIEDSLSPAHAVSPEQLQGVAKQTGIPCAGNLHAAIERSVPAFNLGTRMPQQGNGTPLQALEAILTRCYAGADRNRKDLTQTVKAACTRDEKTLDAYRLRAATDAAGILADALASLFPD